MTNWRKKRGVYGGAYFWQFVSVMALFGLKIITLSGPKVINSFRSHVTMTLCVRDAMSLKILCADYLLGRWKCIIGNFSTIFTVFKIVKPHYEERGLLTLSSIWAHGTKCQI